MKGISKILLLMAIIGGALWALLVHFENKQLVTLHIHGSAGTHALTIPLKDKKHLEYLFQQLIIEDFFGYTLLGDKPLSFGGYLKPLGPSSLPLIYQSVLPSNLRTYWAWKTWLKYAPFFKSSDYLVWTESNPKTESGDCIFIASRKNMLRVISEHADDFHEILGKDINLENIFQDIANGSPLLPMLKNHERLIGILLGYGKNNARLFHEKNQTASTALTHVWEIEVENQMLDSLSFSNCLFGDPKKNLSSFLQYPQFMGDPTSMETEQLKQEYRSTREKIITHYEGKDFLEPTLSLLMLTQP